MGSRKRESEHMNAVSLRTEEHAYTLSSSGSYYPSNQRLKSNTGSQALACTRVSDSVVWGGA